MCDTLALKRDGAVWFAKNSDREPEETQIIEYHPPAADGSSRLSCTHIEIDQVPERRGVVLSRPAWMWGAEMGVNDAGVALGNEAVFSRRMMKKGAALTGMDLVRLGLERSASASEAARVIIALIEQWGQGGPAGYRDKSFRYDSSFLIADADEIIVLETAGREHALKRVSDGWSISNAYTLHTDYDAASDGVRGDFSGVMAQAIMPRLACAAEAQPLRRLRALRRRCGSALLPRRCANITPAMASRAARTATCACMPAACCARMKRPPQ